MYCRMLIYMIPFSVRDTTWDMHYGKLRDAHAGCSHGQTPLKKGSWHFAYILYHILRFLGRIIYGAVYEPQSIFNQIMSHKNSATLFW